MEKEVTKYLSKIGAEGGKSKSRKKLLAARLNIIKAVAARRKKLEENY